MKKYNLMGIVIEDRRDFAPDVQKVLTRYGDVINMRIGLHDSPEKNNTNEGFIILSLIDDDIKVGEFMRELGNIESVRVKNIKV